MRQSRVPDLLLNPSMGPQVSYNAFDIDMMDSTAFSQSSYDRKLGLGYKGS